MASDGPAAPSSRFHEAMQRLLQGLPPEVVPKLHPTKGAMALFSYTELHRVFPATPDDAMKDAAKSGEYRKQGNDLFQEKKFSEALEMFNLSAMFAPLPSKKDSLTGQKNDRAESVQSKPTSETAGESGDEVDGNRTGGAAEVNGQDDTQEDVDVVANGELGAKQDNQTAGRNKPKQRKNRRRKAKNKKGKSGKSADEIDREDQKVHTPESCNGMDTPQETSEENGNGVKESQTEDDGTAKEDNQYTMSYVVANRSASLFFLHRYQECLEDIDMALDLGYPEELMFKLHERKGKCFAQLGRNQEAIDSFKEASTCLSTAKLDHKGKQNVIQSLEKQIRQVETNKMDTTTPTEKQTTAKSTPTFESPSNAKFADCTTTAFEMSESTSRGRHVVAARDVDLAEVVTRESPFSCILYPEYYSTHCNRCLTRVLVATPCRRCSRVIYCSAQCEQEAWRVFHQVECPVLSWLHPTWVGRLGHLAFRTALVAGYATLKRFYSDDSDEAQRERSSVFGADGVYATGYAGVFHLVDNLQQRSPENIFNFALVAAFLIKVFFTAVACLFRSHGHQTVSTDPVAGQARTAPGDNPESPKTAAPSCGESPEASGPSSKQLETLSLALTHHLQVIQCNAFAIPEMQGKEDFRTYVPRDVGVGLYPVHGLLNHSCDPDLDLCFHGNTMVGRAVKGVAKGSEICVDYGVLYFTQPREVRQTTLRTQYYFDCMCPACMNDWPLWQDIECTVPTFRCGGCRGALPRVSALGGQLPTHIECSCGHETPIMRNLSELNASHQRYAIAMQLRPNSDNSAIVRTLIEHLRTMDRFIAPPWRDYVSCQSSIKQSFRLLGSWHHVLGEIPPPE